MATALNIVVNQPILQLRTAKDGVDSHVNVLHVLGATDPSQDSEPECREVKE